MILKDGLENPGAEQMSNYRECSLRNAMLLMRLLKLSSIDLDKISKNELVSRKEKLNLFKVIGRSTVFYVNGELKQFFKDNPKSEKEAKSREPSSEELGILVPFLRKSYRLYLIEELIDSSLGDLHSELLNNGVNLC